MNRFTFKSYHFDESNGTAHFVYKFEQGQTFEEKVAFQVGAVYDKALLDRALFLAFVLAGTSYYKSFPSREVVLDNSIDQWQADFFSTVFQEGLGQFAFENQLTRDDLAHFEARDNQQPLEPTMYSGSGSLVLQSGGKDSLLLASLLQEKAHHFTPWYVASSEYHPGVLDSLSEPLVTARRTIDREGIKAARENGATNGHVPITYIVESFAIIQAILLNKSEVVVAIAHEGEEPDARVGDLAVTHQWSKTWSAEQALVEYVSRYISPSIRIGSPLRQYSELRVAELFVEHTWKKYGHQFSSCNEANYQQGADNRALKWCGHCPKCANAYLLFAPFLESSELKVLFNGQDLFASPILQDTFKGLLGIDKVPKPFECIGEIDELRFAYAKAQVRGGYAPLSFAVPTSSFDYMQMYPAQEWATKMLQ